MIDGVVGTPLKEFVVRDIFRRGRDYINFLVERLQSLDDQRVSQGSVGRP